MHRPFGRCPIGGRRPRWSAGPRLDSRTLETVANVGAYSAVIRTGIWRSPGLAVAGFALPDNCIAISTDRALRASSTLAPVAVQPACRCGNAGLFRVADQVMPEGQPFAGLSQNARFDKLCGPALPALERTTSCQRRAGDREPPPRPIGGDPFGRTGMPRKPRVTCSPRREPRGAHRRAWPGRTRPRRCPLPRGHGRTRQAGTGLL